MIGGANKIFVVDTKTSKAQELTVEQLYMQLIELSKDGTIEVPESYKIRDGGGFTTLKTLAVCPLKGPLYEVRSSNRIIYVSGDQKLMSYNKEKPTVGYHGASDYELDEIVTAEEASQDLPFDALCDTWEHPVLHLKVFDLDSAQAILTTLDSFMVWTTTEFIETEKVYFIETRSGTFNCDGIYMKDSR